MPNKMFLHLHGIKGESKAARHVGEIEILSWAWSGRQRGQMLALGAPQGELSMKLTDDLNVTKARDKTSQTLFEACAAGKKFIEATVTTELVRDDGKLLQALVFKLKDVLITSIAANTEDFITLSFENGRLVYRVKD